MVRDFTAAFTLRMMSLELALIATSWLAVGTAPLLQLAAVFQAVPDPPTQVMGNAQFTLLDPSKQLVQIPFADVAELKSKSAKLAFNVPDTAKVQGDPGLRLSLVTAEVPFKDALPTTVMVRLASPEKLPEVPLVMVKSPAVVDMFLPLRSKVPALCAKLTQERAFVANWRMLAL